jgi:hypothetical protein
MKADVSLDTGREEQKYTEINMSRIQVGGEAAGFLFAASSVYIFVVGIPALRSFLVGAVLAGLVISMALRLFHKYKPSRPVTPILS